MHLAAVRGLGDDYTDAEYIEAVEQARVEGAGVLYADRILGPDLDDALRGVEEEEFVGAGVGHRLNAKLGEPLRSVDVQRRADEILRRRGVRPDRASQAEMLDALLQAS